jgi:hypothetical protein
MSRFLYNPAQARQVASGAAFAFPGAKGKASVFFFRHYIGKSFSKAPYFGAFAS